MKVVALISGGKDSCFNIMQCIAAGHEIVALANLYPVGKGTIIISISN
jgi:diphthine-ammonia ligase